MKDTFAKQIHLPTEIKKDLKGMCVDFDTNPKHFIEALVIEKVKEYLKKTKK